MNITFYYQFYQKQNISPEDHFSDILKNFDYTYNFEVSDMKTLYFRIDPQDPKIKKLGLMTVSKDNQLFSVVKEISISFVDIEGDDRYTTCEHLITVFGEQATSCRIEEERFLNEPS